MYVHLSRDIDIILLLEMMIEASRGVSAIVSKTALTNILYSNGYRKGRKIDSNHPKA